MRALVVGFGRMGKFHAQVLKDFNYEVETVDPDPYSGATWASIDQAMQANRRYDAAVIASPQETLMESAQALVGTPMLVEKPFTTNVRDAMLLAAYLQASGPVAVGFVERFNPRLIELKERLKGEHVIEAKFCRWSDRQCKDLERDLLIHDVDLTRFLGLDAGARDQYERVGFDVRANSLEKMRSIDVVIEQGDGYKKVSANLMDHSDSPLHAQWRAFIHGSLEVARPVDAVAALLGAQKLMQRGRVEYVGESSAA